MKKGTKVTWTLKDGSKGLGVTISDEADGHVMVAVDFPMSFPDMRSVIYCATTWLTAVA